MTYDTTAVITTIQKPTACVRKLCSSLAVHGIPLLAMGDKKGPFEYDQEGAELFTLSQQGELPFKLAKILPDCHYTRKNLGYLVAISRGAKRIYETDDDNAPNDVWILRDQTTTVRKVSKSGWCNVYSLYTRENIWPRGLPLDHIRDAAELDDSPAAPVRAPIQQGLANLSPDVDAVWRLTMDREFYFDDSPSVILSKGTWCPFNSQTTWWWPSAYPLMYLPSLCPFRMTDIWRSFVAQRCLWEFAEGLVFHHAEADQDRNFHNLMRDFTDEIPGYVQNDTIIKILEKLDLKGGEENICGNLHKSYESLVACKIFPVDEMKLVEAWIGDIAAKAGK
jgi:hypothetical protein